MERLDIVLGFLTLQLWLLGLAGLATSRRLMKLRYPGSVTIGRMGRSAGAWFGPAVFFTVDLVLVATREVT